MTVKGSSRQITSNQTGSHPDLLEKLQRHLQSPFIRPFQDFNRQAFVAAEQAWQQHGGKLILDTGCGTGVSTINLAKQNPEHFVMGVDQSADRLEREKEQLPENMLLVRADLIDFWRLAAQAKWDVEQHYLLYPNPWPKKKHLPRRWHGHAVLPYIISLGSTIECRSNWPVYIEEFAQSVQSLTTGQVSIETFQPEIFLTPFEKKYQQSGHDLWRCRIESNQPSQNLINYFNL